MNGYFRGFMPSENESPRAEIKEPPQRRVDTPAESVPAPRSEPIVTPQASPEMQEFNNRLAEGTRGENLSSRQDELNNRATERAQEEDFSNPPVAEEKSLKETEEPPSTTPYSGQGSLVVQVFMARRALPLEDVKITVTSVEGAPIEVSEIRFTDRDGRIEPIFLPTPDISLSEQAQNTIQPYAVYAITPELSGYHVNGGQKNALVFDSVQSIQNIEMIPDSERGV